MNWGCPRPSNGLRKDLKTAPGIHVAVDIPASFVRLAPDAEVALFRIVQESLANVHRYSGKRHRLCSCAFRAGEVRLEIGDFGKGMREESKKPNRASVAPLGVGIQGMKERVRQLSGTLEITPGRAREPW